MKRVIGVLALSLSLVGAASASDWQIDPVHSGVTFKVKHMVISTVPGKFTDFGGAVHFDGTNWEQATVNMTVKTASITTDNDKRDGHLRSSDFFAADSFPDITFTSKKVIKGEGNTFRLVGDMTMRGVTKEVAFDCEFYGLIDDSQGNQRAGFAASTSINRQDFGVKWNRSLDAGGLVVSDDVKIELSIAAVRQKS